MNASRSDTGDGSVSSSPAEPAADGSGAVLPEDAVLTQAEALPKDEARNRLQRSAEILRTMVEQSRDPDDVKAALEQLRRIDRVLASLS